MTLPSLSREEVLALPGVADLAGAGPAIIGIRGFFDQPDHNQRGVYDDAAFFIGPAPEDFRTFNWNTDPTITKPGMAVLQPGTWEWKKGVHGMHHLNLNDLEDKAAYDWLMAHVGYDHPNPKYHLSYWAFRQAAPMTVLRDGQTTPETEQDPDKWPYIDGHHGGLGTSSEGCQTVPIEQWGQFRSFGYTLMDKYKATRIKYHLLAKS